MTSSRLLKEVSFLLCGAIVSVCSEKTFVPAGKRNVEQI